tara:strand:- start:6155 stop:6574 length:420 start_codon:yes stop_codon:yes gene_type:complete
MSYKVIGKYIKDLNFKVPNAKTFSLLSKNISNYKINIDINSNQIKNQVIEIELSLNLIPTKNELDKIETKIVYSTIIELTEEIKDKKEVEKIILIDVPFKVYPELRKIFIFIFENSGFKDIKINEVIDFQQLYNQRENQ